MIVDVADPLLVVFPDPYQLGNVADEADYLEIKQKLAAQLTEALLASQDPRAAGQGGGFDEFPYYGGSPLHPDFERSK